MLQILFAAFIKKSKKLFQFYTISSTFSAVGVIVGWERQWDDIFKSLQTYINVDKMVQKKNPKKNKQTNMDR